MNHNPALVTLFASLMNKTRVDETAKLAAIFAPAAEHGDVVTIPQRLWTR